MSENQLARTIADGKRGVADDRVLPETAGTGGALGSAKARDRISSETGLVVIRFGTFRTLVPSAAEKFLPL
jgi:hypothetical protein